MVTWTTRHWLLGALCAACLVAGWPAAGIGAVQNTLSGQDATTLQARVQQLSNEVGMETQHFFQGLQPWLSNQLTDAQAVALVQGRLLPLSDSLTEKLNQLASLTVALSTLPDAGETDAAGLRTFGGAAFAGAHAFARWRSLLPALLEANARGDVQRVQALAAERMPAAVQGSALFVQQMVALGRGAAPAHTTGVAPPGAAPSTGNAPLGPMEIQALSNMNRMMHETSMAIINNLGDGSTTYDHYDNGAFIGTW